MKHNFSFMLFSSLFLATSSDAASNQTPPLTPNLAWKGRIVAEFAEELGSVRVKSEGGIALIGQGDLDALARQYGVFSIEKLIPGSKKMDDGAVRDMSRYYVLEFPEEIDLSEVAEAYDQSPHVVSAEPYRVHRYLYTPNDSLYSSQWALPQIEAETAYDYCQGSADVIFGLVDSGVDTAHEDLRDNIWVNPGEDLNGNGVIDPGEWNNVDDDQNGFIDDFWGWNVWQGNNNVQDPLISGHGTHCAGDADAVTDNALGVASPGWKAKIMTAKAGDGMYIYSGAAGISYCIDNGADVVNLSWGGSYYSFYEQSLINYGWSQGVVFVAAAGSDGASYPIYPAAYEHVLGVGATDPDDHKASFSNWGDYVDVYAPGVSLLSTVPSNGYAFWSGTSFSAALTSGLACLVRAADPTLTNEEIVQQIINTAVNIDSLNPGYEGLLRINAGAAIASLFWEVSLVPFATPVIIPSFGGSFEFYAFAENGSSLSQEVDLWTEVILPDSSVIGPLMGGASSVLNTGTTGWYRIQNVPGSAPGGIYTYVGCVGEYPDEVWASNSFEIEKLGTAGDFSSGDWSNEGEPLIPGTFSSPDVLPQRMELDPATPNPFNPTTRLRFTLPCRTKVTLTVYDTVGRRISNLLNGYLGAGIHEVTFDGSHLASGIYLYRLETGSITTAGKLVFMK